MTKPAALTVHVENIPPALTTERRWVTWRYEWDGNRWTKRPYQVQGVLAKSNDPSTWCAFDAAVSARHAFDGLGFVLGDGWAGVDLDECWADGSPVPDAQGILSRLAATCYVEQSPSGTGSKAIGRSARIGGEIDFAASPPSFTTWQAGRFFTITGRGGGDPSADLSAFLNDWFKPPVEASSIREGYGLAAESTDDELLIAAVANVRNGDAFLALWRGDTAAYGGDHSRADLALCGHLAFWTDYDATRIDRLFRLSNLYRPKWDQSSYRRATLAKVMR